MNTAAGDLKAELVEGAVTQDGVCWKVTLKSRDWIDAGTRARVLAETWFCEVD